MIGALQKFIAESFGMVEINQAPLHTIEVAVAILLIEVALSDNHLDPSERDQILISLQDGFSLTEAEVSHLMDLAHEEHGQSISFRPMIRVINDSLEPEEKYILMFSLWRVALADQRLDKYEEHQIRQIADWLHIPHREFIRAKLEAKKEMGP
jgi:uncharacterized tellurite resistance protein B-like protein